MVILIIIIVYENKMSDVRFKKNGKVLLEILEKMLMKICLTQY